MHNVRSLALAAAGLALLATSLPAQTGTGQVKWAGVNGTTGKYNTSGTGSYNWYVYTSPYRAQFQINEAPSPLLPPAGTSGFGPVSDIFCVDFNHYANTGTYNAFFTNLGDAQTHSSWLGTYTRSTSLTNYLASAYLVEQIKLDPGNAGLYNGAIWKLMSGQPNFWWNGASWVDVTATANYALNTGWATVNASNWVVVTGGSTSETGAPLLDNGQEYITQVTPEPATLLLMGTGLLAMVLAGAVLRRPTA